MTDWLSCIMEGEVLRDQFPHLLISVYSYMQELNEVCFRVVLRLTYGSSNNFYLVLVSIFMGTSTQIFIVVFSVLSYMLADFSSVQVNSLTLFKLAFKFALIVELFYRKIKRAQSNKQAVRL